VFEPSSDADFGIVFWSQIADSNQVPFGSIEFDIQKQSCYLYGYMGISFYYQDDNSYYLASIDVAGKNTV
jgi:hypothetical protein